MAKKRKSGSSRHGKEHPSAETLLVQLEGLLELTEMENGMKKAVEHFRTAIANIRPGRSDAGMLDHLVVDSPNGKVPIKAVGTVTVKDPETLSLGLFDSDSCPSVIAAIEASPLQLQTKTINQQELLVLLPKRSKEQLDILAKMVGKEAEHSKVMVRNARKVGMDEVKKLSSAEDRKQGEKAVESLTSSFTTTIDSESDEKQRTVRLDS